MRLDSARLGSKPTTHKAHEADFRPRPRQCQCPHQSFPATSRDSDPPAPALTLHSAALRDRNTSPVTPSIPHTPSEASCPQKRLVPRPLLLPQTPLLCLTLPDPPSPALALLVSIFLASLPSTTPFALLLPHPLAARLSLLPLAARRSPLTRPAARAYAPSSTCTFASPFFTSYIPGRPCTGTCSHWHRSCSGTPARA
ncbi:hypothetical protein JCM24511_03086 [Saitozyma sp. JCM 24511]|nr:hypothetical protein JCM24511_03086 [Saitozyma sp. JCM 24511]